MKKKCAFCEQMVRHDLLDCPKCGRGVFETEKIHSKPNHASAQKGSEKQPIMNAEGQHPERIPPSAPPKTSPTPAVDTLTAVAVRKTLITEVEVVKIEVGRTTREEKKDGSA